MAHEALLREWPRLRGWLEEDAEGRRLHAHLIARGARNGATTAAIAASSTGARGWPPRWSGAPSTSRSSTRSSSSSSTRAGPRASAPGAGSGSRSPASWRCSSSPPPRRCVALDQRGQREDADPSSRSPAARRSGAQRRTTLDLSLLLARQGVALDDAPATRDNLLAALRRSPAAVGVMRPGVSSWPRSTCRPAAEPRGERQQRGGGFLEPSHPAAARAATGRTAARRAARWPPLPTAAASRPPAYDAAGRVRRALRPADPAARRATARLNHLLSMWRRMVFTPDSRQLLVQVNDAAAGDVWR